MPSPINDSKAREWTAKPRVTVGAPNFVAQLGPYPIALFSSTLESTGLVTYHHLLAVFSPEGEELCFVSAESSALGGANSVYFCLQHPDGHENHFDSALLLVTPVFFCFACQAARSYLSLDWQEAPMSEPERQALQVIPRVCDEHVPNWRTGYKGVLERLMQGMPEDVAEADELRRTLDPMRP